MSAGTLYWGYRKADSVGPYTSVSRRAISGTSTQTVAITGLEDDTRYTVVVSTASNFSGAGFASRNFTTDEIVVTPPTVPETPVTPMQRPVVLGNPTAAATRNSMTWRVS